MMLSGLVIAVLVTTVLASGWVAVQSLVRRHSPDIEPGEDVLACRMCAGDGSCHCGLRLLKKEISDVGKNDAS